MSLNQNLMQSTILSNLSTRKGTLLLIQFVPDQMLEQIQTLMITIQFLEIMFINQNLMESTIISNLSTRKGTMFLIQFVPDQILEQIQALIKTQLKSLSLTKMKTLFLKTYPLDIILSKELIQHSLSFLSDPSPFYSPIPVYDELHNCFTINKQISQFSSNIRYNFSKHDLNSIHFNYLSVTAYLKICK